MSDAQPRPNPREETPVDDVRRVRERLAREDGGDIRRHIEQTRQATEELVQKLGLKRVQPPGDAKAPDPSK